MVMPKRKKLPTGTQKSTLSKIKQIPGKPKKIVSVLHDEAGVSLGASSVSALPRNRRQIYNSI